MSKISALNIKQGIKPNKPAGAQNLLSGLKKAMKHSVEAMQPRLETLEEKTDKGSL